MTDIFLAKRCALLIAHPGHEIRVHAWMERARPLVYILTDGSGSAGRPRLASTTRLLRGFGASCGSIYGRYTDLQIYQATLTHDHQLFCGLVRELADEIEREEIEVIVGDAQEGAILTHDLWRSVIDSALALAERRTGRRCENFDFFLEGSPLAAASTPGARAVSFHLDEQTWRRKLLAARSYPELQQEVEFAFTTFGEEAFRTEVLRKAPACGSMNDPVTAVPQYERHGESQVRLGKYQQVIRYAEHVAPLRLALQREAA